MHRNMKSNNDLYHNTHPPRMDTKERGEREEEPLNSGVQTPMRKNGASTSQQGNHSHDRQLIKLGHFTFYFLFSRKTKVYSLKFTVYNIEHQRQQYNFSCVLLLIKSNEHFTYLVF